MCGQRHERQKRRSYEECAAEGKCLMLRLLSQTHIKIYVRFWPMPDIRGRLQWDNLVQHVSPYGELAYSRGCLDAYSETGGGFPAAFNKLCDKSTELRYGFDAAYPVSPTVRLIGTLEGVHRFEKKSANVTGQAIGLYAFDLGGAAYRQNWLRAGVGLATQIGGSVLSVMGNATTQSGGTNAWLAVNWRMDF